MRKVQEFLENNIKKVLIAVGIVAVIIIVVMIVIWWQNSVEEKERIQQGISYLESLESKDIDEVNSKVKAVKAEMSLGQAEENEEAVWIGFEDAVILGDSRAVGFSYYGFLSEEQAIAEKGARITDVEDHIAELKATNPGQAFICFGLNDIQSGLWDDPESYSEQCAEIIEMLMKELPQCDIYLNSILPAGDAAIASDSNYTRIGEYNDSMKRVQFC